MSNNAERYQKWKWLSTAATILCSLAASGEDYPSKPIRFVVPFSAGSAADVRARHLGSLVSPRLGQSIVIDNRPGASGTIGAGLVAKAKPDGYTLLFCTGSTHGVNSALIPDLGYDPKHDFAPVVRIVSVPVVLVVNPSLSARSLRELVQLAKAKPGQLRCGSAGNASSNHLAGELFARRAGIDLLHVPYKGSAMTDVIAGHIDMLLGDPSVVLPQVAAGRLRALAVAGPRRLPTMPDVPTMSEAGIQGSEFVVWMGLCAPAGTPRSVVGRLNQETLTVVLTPEVKSELQHQGYEVVANSPEEFSTFIGEEIVRAAKLVKELNIQPDH